MEQKLGRSLLGLGPASGFCNTPIRRSISRWAPTDETNIAMKGSLRNCWLGYTGYTTLKDERVNANHYCI
jgi:hypothetical protein